MSATVDPCVGGRWLCLCYNSAALILQIDKKFNFQSHNIKAQWSEGNERLMATMATVEVRN